MVSSISISDAAKSAGCSAAFVYVGERKTHSGNRGQDNGPEEFATSYRLDVVVPEGWTFDGCTVKERTEYTMWNRLYYTEQEMPSPTERTYSVGAGGTVDEIVSTETCANPLSSEDYHGDHHLKYVSIIEATATFHSASRSSVTVSVSSSDTTMGTAAGGDTRQGYVGATCTFALTATPTDRKKYKFDGWYEGGTRKSTDEHWFPVFTFQSEAQTHNYVARFSQVSSRITLTTSKSGTIPGWTTSPSSETKYKYSEETAATFSIRATKDSSVEDADEWAFDYWSCSSSGVTISDPHSQATVVSVEYNTSGTAKSVNLVAHFKSTKKYRVTIAVADDGSGGGFASGGGSGEKLEGEQLCKGISATAYLGYRFTGWTSSKGGSLAGEDETVCITASKTEEDNTVTWTAHFEPTGSSGSEPPGPSGSEPPIPPPGPSGSSGPSEEHSSIKVTVSSDNAKMGSVSGSDQRTGIVGNQATFNLVAKLKDAKKYKFLGWYENGACVSESLTYSPTFTYKSGYTEESPETHSFVAKFDYAGKAIVVSTGVSVSDSGWSTSGDDTRVQGTGGTPTSETFLLTASKDDENSSYRFDHWAWTDWNGTEHTSTQQVMTVSIPYPESESESPRQVHFEAVLVERRQVTVTFQTETDGHGTATGGGSVTVYEGDNACVNVNATPNSGYYFVRWLLDGAVLSTDESATACVKATQSSASKIHKVRAEFGAPTVQATVKATGESEGWTVWANPEKSTYDGSATSAVINLGASDGTKEEQKVKYKFVRWECDDPDVTIDDPESQDAYATVPYNLPPDSTEYNRAVEFRAVFEEREKFPVKIVVGVKGGGGWVSGGGEGEGYEHDKFGAWAVATANEGHEFCWWEDENGNITENDDAIVAEVEILESHPVYYYYAVFTGGESGSSGGGGSGQSGQSGGSGGPGPGPGPTGQSGHSGHSGQSEGPSGSSGSSGPGPGPEPEECDILVSASANRPNGGTVTPASRSAVGPRGIVVSFSFEAKAKPGYQLVRWTEDGVVVKVTAPGTRQDTLTKSYTLSRSGETHRIVAEFIQVCGPVLYDPSTGNVLYGKGGAILYEG